MDSKQSNGLPLNDQISIIPTRTSPFCLQECSVVVRKLSLNEIVRIIINPLKVSYRCNECQRLTIVGKQCAICHQKYHYRCALRRRNCCNSPIIPQQDRLILFKCGICHQRVVIGPECPDCHTKYHTDCVSINHYCCRRKLMKFVPKICGKCNVSDLLLSVKGVKCPICCCFYHYHCVGANFGCCDIKIELNCNLLRKCGRCKRLVKITAPMCEICYKVYHHSCWLRSKFCCGKLLRGDVFFTVKFIENAPKQQKLCNSVNTPDVRMDNESNHEELNREVEKIFIKSEPCEQSSEIDFEKLEIPDIAVDSNKFKTLPEAETTTTNPVEIVDTINSFIQFNNNYEDRTLENLFNYLYGMVKKLPQHLQTQVRMKLFQIVTEAEIQMHQLDK